MKKFIPLVLGLMFPLAGALADDFTDQAVDFCRSKGGAYSMSSMVEEGDNYCRQVICKKTTSDKYVLNEGDKGPEANVEATKRVCISKSIIDGNFNTNGAGNGNSSGSASGSNSGSNSGATSGSASGDASAGAGTAVTCEELEGEGRIQPGGLCYDECRPKAAWWTLGLGTKKSGFERKSCVECLLKYPGIYRVKKEYLPRDASGRIIGDNTIDLGKGVTVKTGVIICKDASGNVVTINGQACPTGTTISTAAGVSGSKPTVVISGGAANSGNGSVIIAGGVGAAGGVQLPSYCHSTKQKDIKECEEWMQKNKRFLCASSANPSICMGGADAEIMARYDSSNCVNCAVGSRQQSTYSGVAEILGAISGPLAQFGSAYMGAKAYEKSNKAWAGAAAAGFEQCKLDHNNYYQYLSSNELPGLTPQQQAAMNCNGFALGGYGGLQNPALSGWYGAGYTPGFVSGMMGPYGMYNPYGMQGYGMSGYGMPGNGMVNGISIAGGVNSGYGMPGYGMPGYGMPGYGMPGYGMVNGASVAGGINSGYGMPGYGMVNGVSIAGGINSGYGMPGYGMPGYGMPGYGMPGYGMGTVNGVSIAGGINSGYGMPGYGMVNGASVAGGINSGYGMPGYGMVNGASVAGGMAGGMDYASSQQASNYDRMMQQQGTSFQMGMGGMGGMGTGYGTSAYYNPMNASMTLGGTFGMSGGVGW